ncbi:sialate O-acetylesterase [Neolewinella xylanilytica]|uniref:Sialate O-acetylesterase n=1 Tax=Neolewinella xylanilytica TaxID=1514080 RepID=A0A2S6I5C8_9BACT|nr:sialate O-acetylesterase [Neolewinella xylanilytica]PPK86291.1 sialate O-acetylesterase [Neolewinella xylanilytica]
MRYLIFLFLFCPGGLLLAQDLELFELFTDHALLQRNVAHPIWGRARPNRTVRIILDGESVKTKTNRDGRWQAELPSRDAGGPYVLSVTDGRSTVEISDVYFGDVYLLSGQSNMEWRLAQSDPDSSRAKAIADPLIRQTLIAKTGSGSPQTEIQLDEEWKPGTTDEIADFSAVGGYFAHYLRESGVDIPIGLVHSSWGGSRIEPWIPAAWQEADAQASMEEIEKEMDGRRARVQSFYQAEFGDGFPPVSEDQPNLAYLSDTEPQADWGVTTLPGLWETRGYADVDGVFYYRKRFTLNDAQIAGAAELHLGPIDDNDITYLNGNRVGATNLYSQDRIYRVPRDLLRLGENVLTVRVDDTGGGGGFHGHPDSLYLGTAAGRVPLAGDFAYRIAAFRINSNSRANQTPTLLYNAMIAPLREWPLTGVLWYQGESNAGETDASSYAAQTEALVESWREQFSNDSLPFYWVQLANFMAAPVEPDAPGWALLRAQQTAALSIPNSGQAIITDIGEADDIHPKNKWEVGRRLSLHARKHIYGQQVQASSPVARNIRLEDGAALIDFDQVGEGLTLKMAEGDRYPIVRSLSVRDTAGEWHWAVGLLTEETNALRVLNPAGTGITAVRYAWFNNPDDANLFSKGGLPVTPFELHVD